MKKDDFLNSIYWDLSKRNRFICIEHYSQFSGDSHWDVPLEWFAHRGYKTEVSLPQLIFFTFKIDRWIGDTHFNRSIFNTEAFGIKSYKEFNEIYYKAYNPLWYLRDKFKYEKRFDEEEDEKDIELDFTVEDELFEGVKMEIQMLESEK